MTIKPKWREEVQSNKLFLCYKALDKSGGYVYIPKSLIDMIEEDEQKATRDACFVAFIDLLDTCDSLPELRTELIKWIQHARKSKSPPKQ